MYIYNLGKFKSDRADILGTKTYTTVLENEHFESRYLSPRLQQISELKQTTISLND